MLDINFMLVVSLAVLAGMIFHQIWYSPRFFGEEWMKLAHVSKTNATKGRENKFLITCFSLFALATTLFTIITWAGAKTAITGVLVGIWIGCGVSGITLMLPFLWEGRPVRLFLITAGHQIISIIIMCALMAHAIGKFSLPAG